MSESAQRRAALHSVVMESGAVIGPAVALCLRWEEHQHDQCVQNGMSNGESPWRGAQKANRPRQPLDGLWRFATVSII